MGLLDRARLPHGKESSWLPLARFTICSDSDELLSTTPPSLEDEPRKTEREIEREFKEGRRKRRKEKKLDEKEMAEQTRERERKEEELKEFQVKRCSLSHVNNPIQQGWKFRVTWKNSYRKLHNVFSQEENAQLRDRLDSELSDEDTTRQAIRDIKGYLQVA